MVQLGISWSDLSISRYEEGVRIPDAGLTLPSPGPGSPIQVTRKAMQATSWPARVGRRGPHRTSDTSRQVMCSPRFASILLIPSKSQPCINAGGAVVWTAVQYAWGPVFESGDFLYFANSNILSYTAFNAVYTFSIYVYTSKSRYIPVWDVFISMLCNNSVYVGIFEYIPVCALYIMLYISTSI